MYVCVCVCVCAYMYIYTHEVADKYAAQLPARYECERPSAYSMRLARY